MELIRIISIIYLNHELMGVFEEEVDLQSSDEFWIQIVMDYFCLTHLYLLLIHPLKKPQDTECVTL